MKNKFQGIEKKGADKIIYLRLCNDDIKIFANNRSLIKGYTFLYNTFLYKSLCIFNKILRESAVGKPIFKRKLLLSGPE